MGRHVTMDWIRVRGAAEHNLKNVSLDLPRGTLTVITGVSGSGKSSLAFDTIFREGQRRFLESLPAYARRFLGTVEKPDVEAIEGLSPAVSIDQKTIGRNPRSTVGTITEVHDYLRLLYARLGLPHCHRCHRPVETQSAERIAERIVHRSAGKRVLICAPVIRDRKGEHRSVLQDLTRDGFRRVIIDGSLVRLGRDPLELTRQQRHTIEIVYDRLPVGPETLSRLTESVEKCLALAEGMVTLRELPQSAVEPAADRESSAGEPGPPEMFSCEFTCPHCAVDLPELEPRLFSFNSPHGMCPVCDGLGEVESIAPESVVSNPSAPLSKGGVDFMLPHGGFFHKSLDYDGFLRLGRRRGITPRSSWGDLDQDTRQALLFGDEEYPGWVPVLSRLAREEGAAWVRSYLRLLSCEACQGTRLRPEARSVRFQGRTIAELCDLSASDLRRWLGEVDVRGSEAVIAAPILRDLLTRLQYLEEVGLDYLTMSRRATTLSGGEAQRLRLAGQVGAGLQGILYVLDEPSIGLHPRDNGRLIETLHRLRAGGNTVIEVEHDEATMKAADHLVDVGPGAGPLGGEVVATGRTRDLILEPRSVTGSYLSGKKRIEVPTRRRAPAEQYLEIYGARQNNLKDVDVRVPLQRLVVVTGVSGSGKSSLINQVLYPSLLHQLGRWNLTPGHHRSLKGYRNLDKVVIIDQSPIGKSPRSNPATYVKAFDAIRELFAMVTEARARGYKPGRFSFNKDGGRCLDCGGAGVKVVEMQFLAPVEVICDTCDGKRYNRETLEILYRGMNIADVLAMTISEAETFFADHSKIARPLVELRKIGLGYMSLGQPATTLSGGEAQRVKLASALRRRDTGRTLYILDEPTTGLHFEDVGKLVCALDELVERRNSVVVIEHNLDVVKVADHVIDLGPEAGEAGGHIVAQGTPEEICAVTESHTGRALRAALDGQVGGEDGSTGTSALPDEVALATHSSSSDLIVQGARIHNLQAVDVTVPRNSLTVITGVSGSGKTSLALDTIFAEGQRRYVESLSTYARRFLRQMQTPPVDLVAGLAPSIAIDQHSASSNRRSTVATITEIYDYLRIFYARVGRPHCPLCEVPLTWTTPSRLAAATVESSPGTRAYVLAPHLVGGGEDSSGRPAPNVSLEEVQKLRTALLASGFTRVLVGEAEEEVRLDEEGDLPVRRILARLRADRPEGQVGADRRGPLGDEPAPGSGSGSTLQIVVDRVVLGPEAQTRLASSLETAFERGGGRAALKLVGHRISWHTRHPTCPSCGFVSEEELTPRSFSFNSHHGACVRCGGLGVEERVEESLLVPEPGRPLPGALDSMFHHFLRSLRPSVHRALAALLAERGLSGTPVTELSEKDRLALLYGRGVESVALPLEDGSPVNVTWDGLIPALELWVRLDTLGPATSVLKSLLRPKTCSTCHGGRLRPEFLAVRIGGRNIREFTTATIDAALAFLKDLDLTDREARIAEQVLREITGRLRFLSDVGLGYLTLDRTADTLSGGEAQRIRLASQLGNRLAGVIYVLDEPTIGLHQRDTQRLLATLRDLRDLGNTVLVVEHDRECMLAAEQLIEMGPEAGHRGGRVVAASTPRELVQNADSLTARYLRGDASAIVRRAERPVPDAWLRLEGVNCHNLKNVSVEFPLERLIVVTGVSGSGKSSLVLDVLSTVVGGTLHGERPPEDLVRAASGYEAVERVVVVDQRPLGRSPRSNPATYTGLWDHVRELFARLPLSKVRGYRPSRFSFNLPEGRCGACEGQGAKLVEMHFLSDVWVPCDVCRGKRFNLETQKVLFKGKNVGEILDLEIDEASELFENQPSAKRVLESLQAVGLGYVKLGQPANTLSGGEAQRVKLASELVSRGRGRTLYILDEPTTGLHFEDVKRLLEVLQELVQRGNTVVVIEHHLDVVRSADWVLDLGPGAGEDGGQVVASGPPEEIARHPESLTGQCLTKDQIPVSHLNR